MHQFVLRQISPELFSTLKKKAQKSGTSINSAILQTLKISLGFDASGKRQRKLSSLAGTWTQKDLMEFRDKTKIFEKIDTELWQK